MRAQINIPPRLVERLSDMARREYRTPRQQLEYLVAGVLSGDIPLARDFPTEELTATAGHR